MNKETPRTLGRKTFIRHVKKLFALQVLLVGLFWAMMQSLSNHPYFIPLFVGFILFMIVTELVFILRCDLAGRLKDIFPRYKFRPIQVNSFFLFPGLVIPLIIYLSLKRKGTGSKPFAPLYSLPHYFMLIIPLLAIQFIMPGLSHWSANPSTYYISKIGHESLDIIKFKKNSKTRSVKDYFEENKKVTTPGIIFLSAVAASWSAEKNKRDLASKEEKTEYTFQRGLKLFKEMDFLYKKSQESKFSFSDYGWTQWLSPIGLVEISALAIVENQARVKFHSLVSEKVLGMIKGFEKNLSKLPESKRETYRKELMILKESFSS